jgi:hypothetical protein
MGWMFQPPCLRSLSATGLICEGSSETPEGSRSSRPVSASGGSPRSVPEALILHVRAPLAELQRWTQAVRRTSGSRRSHPSSRGRADGTVLRDRRRCTRGCRLCRETLTFLSRSNWYWFITTRSEPLVRVAFGERAGRAAAMLSPLNQTFKSFHNPRPAAGLSSQRKLCRMYRRAT